MIKSTHEIVFLGLSLFLCCILLHNSSHMNIVEYILVLVILTVLLLFTYYTFSHTQEYYHRNSNPDESMVTPDRVRQSPAVYYKLGVLEEPPIDNNSYDAEKNINTKVLEAIHTKAKKIYVALEWLQHNHARIYQQICDKFSPPQQRKSAS